MLFIRRCFFLACGTSVRSDDPTLVGTEHDKLLQFCSAVGVPTIANNDDNIGLD